MFGKFFFFNDHILVISSTSFYLSDNLIFGASYCKTKTQHFNFFQNYLLTHHILSSPLNFNIMALKNILSTKQIALFL